MANSVKSISGPVFVERSISLARSNYDKQYHLSDNSNI